MSGGNSGEAVIPFNHLDSELWILCASGEMPPGPNNLTFVEINLISQWNLMQSLLLFIVK